MTLERGIRFVWENARLLDRTILEHRFYGGPSARIVEVLRTYQNADGGFGNALEADIRAPDSQPVCVEFALRALYECNIRGVDMAYRACDFLAWHADLKRGIPTLFPSSGRYPRAAHWNNPQAQEPSFDRLVGLVGLASWQGIAHPWLRDAVGACLEHLSAARYDDAHTILNAFCLLESLPQSADVDRLFDRLAHALSSARFFLADVPAAGYGLTPLSFAPTPDSYCRHLFSDAQIQTHLADLVAKQDPDGGWPIEWDPPGDMARCEWRAHRAVNALSTLRAYGRI